MIFCERFRTSCCISPTIFPEIVDFLKIVGEKGKDPYLNVAEFIITAFYESSLQLTQNYFMEAFATLGNHINYLNPNVEDMTVLY